MNQKICPECKSKNIMPDGTLINVSLNAGICRKCGYRNINFPEIERKTSRRKKIRWHQK